MVIVYSNRTDYIQFKPTYNKFIKSGWSMYEGVNYTTIGSYNPHPRPLSEPVLTYFQLNPW